MTNEELFQIMRPIVETVTGLTQVILADPNAPAPLGEYCAIRPKQSIAERGQANIYYTDDGTNPDVSVDVRAQIVCEMLLEFYRGEALSYAELIKQANKRPDISLALYKATPQPIGWQRTSNVINLTALQSDNFEQRAQISIYLLYELINANNVVITESIERVPYQIFNEELVEINSGEVVTPDAP